MKNWILLVVTILFINSIQAIAANSDYNKSQQKYVRVFDWDDTILYMPTLLKLFKKGSDNVLLVSTEEYALEKENFGKAGTKYAEYEIRRVPNNPHLNSFQHFGNAADVTGQVNYFRDDILRLLKASNIKQSTSRPWQAPGFELLLNDLSSYEQAKLTYVLTARGHSPLEMLQGLQEIKKYVKQSKNLNLYMPPQENLIGVDGAPNTSLRKTEILVDLALQYQELGVHRLEFLDDDLRNVEFAKKGFEQAKEKLSRIQTSVVHIVKKPLIPLCQSVFGKAG